MTQKELLYLEDAVGHETTIISVIEDSINNLDDENLSSFMQEQLDIHTSMKEDLMNLLKEKTNE